MLVAFDHKLRAMAVVTLQAAHETVGFPHLQTAKVTNNRYFTLIIIKAALGNLHNIDTKKAIDEGHPFDDSLQWL